MRDFIIRAATLDDLGAVDTLLQNTYPALLKQDYPPSVLVTALPRMVKAQTALLGSGTYYVAEDAAGDLLGAGGWTFALPGGARAVDPTRANVRHVVTALTALRRGVGRALMTHAFAEARRQGATWMHCLATRTAVPFYTSVGFETVQDISVPMGPGVEFPSVEMRRDL